MPFCCLWCVHSLLTHQAGIANPRKVRRGEGFTNTLVPLPLLWLPHSCSQERSQLSAACFLFGFFTLPVMENVRKTYFSSIRILLDITVFWGGKRHIRITQDNQREACLPWVIHVRQQCASTVSMVGAYWVAGLLSLHGVNEQAGHHCANWVEANPIFYDYSFIIDFRCCFCNFTNCLRDIYIEG